MFPWAWNMTSLLAVPSHSTTGMHRQCVYGTCQVMFPREGSPWIRRLKMGLLRNMLAGVSMLIISLRFYIVILEYLCIATSSLYMAVRRSCMYWVTGNKFIWCDERAQLEPKAKVGASKICINSFNMCLPGPLVRCRNLRVMFYID